jgi:hypothetical protein
LIDSNVTFGRSRTKAPGRSGLLGKDVKVAKVTVDAIEVLIKYRINSFPQVDQFI